MTIAMKIVVSLRQNLRKALKIRDVPEALSILSRLRREDPASAETRGLELECLLAEGKLEAAESLARQLCQSFPESSRIQLLAGKAFYRRKAYAAAETCFRESEKLYPHLVTKHWLGKTLTQLGKFAEAEALLESLRDGQPAVLLDLAWLSERRKEPQQAARLYETYLRADPENQFARQQLVRLKARMAAPEELIEQLETLKAYGEEIQESLLPEFIHKLFQAGETPRAREEVIRYREKVSAKTQIQLAWICYHAQSYDLALELFLPPIKAHQSDYKILNALEAAAERCCRVEEVLKAYHDLAPSNHHFYGRIRALSKRARKG
jgi:tetratricopeptide (TPR) repeat protein